MRPVIEARSNKKNLWLWGTVLVLMVLLAVAFWPRELSANGVAQDATVAGGPQSDTAAKPGVGQAGRRPCLLRTSGEPLNRRKFGQLGAGNCNR